jgi:hypothetical protein
LASSCCADARSARSGRYAEGLAVDSARELALAAEAEPVVLHAVVLDLRVVVVRRNLERHEVAEVLATGLLQLREEVLQRAHHAEVDVLRGARSFEA